MDKKITNIKDRVLYISEIKGVSREKFFKDLDLSYANFKGIQKKSALNSDAIDKIISKYNDINAEWLITGKGEMLKHYDSLGVVNEPETAYQVAAKQKGIPLIPIDAMAGFGTQETTILAIECDQYIVPAFKGVDFLIQVKGQSMQPRYNSGDIIACKKLTINDTFFQWGKVYVLDTEQGALVKRIRKGKDDNHILAISDNPDYDPFELHLSQLNALAIVMGVIRLV